MSEVIEKNKVSKDVAEQGYIQSPQNKEKEESVTSLSNEIDGKNTVNEEDWLLERLEHPTISTKDLSSIYGIDGFDQLKSEEDYWKDPKVRDKFTKMHGVLARMRFEDYYDNIKKEYSLYKLDIHQNSKTASELFLDTKDRFRTDVTERFQNIWGTLKIGNEYSAPRLDMRESFKFVREVDVDANGNVVKTYHEYSPSLLDTLESSLGINSLAYGDIWNSQDPNAGVYGVFFDTVKDGQIWNDEKQEFVDVRNDQIVSRQDIDTGSFFDGWLKNNKLEADGILDYAKTIVRAPINLFADSLDTLIQGLRVGTTLAYSGANVILDDENDLDVTQSSLYKLLSGVGVNIKSYKTSSSREAMTDGVLGSFEAQLDAVFAVAGQIFLARGLGALGSGAARLIKGNLTGTKLMKAQQAWANMTVRATLTSLAAKDSYNEALDNGYNERDAALITSATFAALWQATRFAGYITGEYDIKQARAGIKNLISEEQKGFISNSFNKLTKEVEKSGSKALLKGLPSKKGESVFLRMSDKMWGFMKNIPTTLNAPGSSKLLFEMQQEALEEMSEEIGQEIIRQGATAYGTIIQKAKKAGEGRFRSIFDEGFFPDLVERTLTSGVLGGLGGGMGMIGSGLNITPVNTVVDIVLQGRQEELFDVLKEMKSNGELGPTDLTTDFNEEMNAFEPVIKGTNSKSLADMVYKMYELDVKSIESFMSLGMNGEALRKLQTDEVFKDDIEGIAMRKDYIRNSTELFALFQKTKLSTSILGELDNLTEEELQRKIPDIVKSVSNKIQAATTEIDKIKKSLSTKPKPADEDTVKKGKKGKLKKESAEKLYPAEEKDTNKDRLSILNKQLESLKSVTYEDVAEMFDLYSRIRSVANGTAAEHYLLQKELYNDEAFGNINKRDDKYKSLGDTPFIDLMHKATFRSIDDERIHLRKVRNSRDVTSNILAIKENDENSVDKLNTLLIKHKGYINKEALEHIKKLRDNSNLFSGIKEMLTVSGKNSIFKKNSNGSREELYTFFIDLLKANPEQNGTVFGSDIVNKLKKGIPLDSLNESDIRSIITDLESNGSAEEYFDTIKNNLFGENLPVIQLGITPEFMDTQTPVTFMQFIQTGTDPISKRLRRSIKKSEMTLAFLGNKADEDLKNKEFFDPNSFKRGDINVIFRTDDKGKFTKQSLLDAGLAEVIDLIDNPLGKNKFYKKDHREIDKVLEQIDIRERMGDVFRKFYGPNIEGYSKMLSGFRRSVLNIIDREYSEDDTPDSLEEVHAYKNKTALSDFFVDFIYDPIQLENALRAEEEGVTTSIDDALLNKFQNVKGTLDQYVTTIDPKTGEKITTLVKINEEALQAEILKEFEGFNKVSDIEKMITGLKKNNLFQIPNNVAGLEGEGTVNLLLGEMTKLKLLKPLLEKARWYVQQSGGGNGTNIPYIENKNEFIEKEFSAYNNIIEEKGMEPLKEYIISLFPEYEELSKRDKHIFSETAKLNIKLEKAMYDIFHTDLLELDVDEDNNQKHLKKNMMEYIRKVGKFTGSTDLLSVGTTLNFLLGAVTTDFSDYYSLSKNRLENIGIGKFALLAAQEHAAKYSAAFVYSEELRAELSDGKYSINSPSYINAVFINGAAGSGKSTAVADIGLDLGINVLKMRDSKAITALAPISNHPVQIDIIAKAIGEKAEGQPGRSVVEVYKLLEDAVIRNNVKAIETLNKLGALVFDEITYVRRESSDDVDITLLNIRDMVKTFNVTHRGNLNEMVMVFIGDTSQSGNVHSNIEPKNVFNTGYMSFSMRARNTFLVEAVSSIKNIKTDLFEIASSGYKITLEKTKYGLLDNKFYGSKVVKTKDVNDTATLLQQLSDPELLSNIEDNLNADKEFSIIVSPASEKDFMNSLDGLPKFKEIFNNSKFEGRVNIISHESIGGSEANYVIAEMPAQNEVQGDISKYMAIKKDIFTLMTRAKDYSSIIIKEGDVIIPGEAESERIDNQVIIPDTSVDIEDKNSYVAYNLKLLEDIEASKKPANVEKIKTKEVKNEEKENKSMSEEFNKRILNFSNDSNKFSSANIEASLNVMSIERGVYSKDTMTIKRYFEALSLITEDYSNRDNYDNFILISNEVLLLKNDAFTDIIKDIQSITSLFEELYVTPYFSGKSISNQSLKTFVNSILSSIDSYMMTSEQSKNKEEVALKALKKEQLKEVKAAFDKFFISNDNEGNRKENVKNLETFLSLYNKESVLSEDEKKELQTSYDLVMKAMEESIGSSDIYPEVIHTAIKESLPLVVFESKEIPPLNVKDESLTDINLLISGLDIKEVTLLIENLEEMQAGFTNRYAFDNNPAINRMFKNLKNKYEFNSIIDNILDKAKEAKEKIRTKTPIDNDKKKLDSILKSLNIKETTSEDIKKKLYIFLNTLDTWKGTEGDKKKRKNTIYAAITLIKKFEKPVPGNSKKVHFYGRDTNTLESYISKIESGLRTGQVYTVKLNPTYMPNGMKNYLASNKIEIANDDIVNKIKGSLNIKKLQLIASKTKKTDIYIITEYEGKKYAIAQFNGYRASGTVADLFNKVNSLFDNESSSVITNGDTSILVLKGLDKNSLVLRAGDVILKGAVKSIKELKENINISSNAYQVNTVGGNRGGYFYLYIENNNIDLNSSEIKKLVQEKGFLGNNRQITIVYNGVELTVGLIPFKTNIPSANMKAFYKDNPGIKIQSFPTMAGYVAQLSMIYYYNRNSDKWNNLTDEQKDYVDKIKTSFENKEKKGEKAQVKKAQELLTQIVASGDTELLNFLIELSDFTPGGTDNGNIFVKTYNNEYTLNLDVLLNSAGKNSITDNLDRLFKITGTRYKLSSTDSSLENDFISIDSAFSSLDEYFESPYSGIRSPEFAIKKSLIQGLTVEKSKKIPVAPIPKPMVHSMGKNLEFMVEQAEKNKNSSVSSIADTIVDENKFKNAINYEKILSKRLKQINEIISKKESIEGLTKDNIKNLESLLNKVQEAISIYKSNNGTIDDGTLPGDKFKITDIMLNSFDNAVAKDGMKQLSTAFVSDTDIRKEVLYNYINLSKGQYTEETRYDDFERISDNIIKSMKIGVSIEMINEIDNLNDEVLVCFSFPPF